VPASRFVSVGAGDENTKSFGRRNAGKFVEHRYEIPRDHKGIAEAQRHIIRSPRQAADAELFRGRQLTTQSEPTKILRPS
jgi:hypothetical protein